MSSRVSALWKGEAASDAAGYLAEEISKQNVGEGAWFFLAAYSKSKGGT